MSTSPYSPRPQRATIARHICSRSWPTVEVPAKDGGEEASQIDLSLDSSTEVGLQFGDDGSVRLLLLSSGGGGDRRSSHLPKLGEWDELSSGGGGWVLDACSGSHIPKPLPSRPPKRSQITKLSSGGGGDRRSSHLPKLGEWDELSSGGGGDCSSSCIPTFGDWDEVSSADGDAVLFSKVREEKQGSSSKVPIYSSDSQFQYGSKPEMDGALWEQIRRAQAKLYGALRLRQITKRVAKIIRLLSSIFKKKKHTDTLPRSVREEAANPLAPEQPKPPTKIVPRTTNIGLAHIFSYEELNQATNSFTHEIADGGFSRVYLGKLQDGRKVAVKVLYEGVPKRMEQFLNEVTALSRLRHKNLVALYGCTDPETQKLLLVYEFVPNGTIADHLHGQLPSLTWDIRMQIAIETAEALSYLHSCEPPIIHRDVKTSNILLDDDYHAKVADLGMCRLVPWDTTFVSTLPQGTVGYRDPEYDELCKLTLKSDVYSFGVVLLELISGKLAVDVYREETEIYLFKMAVTKILNNKLDQLVDLRIGYGSNSEISRMVSSVAALSCACLQPKADPRPPIAEVLQILKGIRDGMYYA